MHYSALSTEELEAEHARQTDVVSSATPEAFIDEWHKLSVLKNMIAWRAVEAARFGGGKKSARKVKVSPREQAGRFEFGSKPGVSGGQCKEQPTGFTEKE